MVQILCNSISSVKDIAFNLSAVSLFKKIYSQKNTFTVSAMLKVKVKTCSIVM